MNWFTKAVLFLYSVIIAVLSGILLYAVHDESIYSELLSALSGIVTDPAKKYGYIVIIIFLLFLSVASILICITSGRMTKTRIRTTDIGGVDIGADAIESIASNSAKSAQVGIKNVKVRVSSSKNNAISVKLNADLYSNVEIPSSMTKVQEKVKKDIERYTGLAVDSVQVKVAKVEPIVAKVDK
ncbi:MAG: alkaline shock response membrane anchor protein AmaP [Clostridia bacterium]|nr:alkaline shock response membrane anchor protein AmaP [Clostridia bacterium]